MTFGIIIDRVLGLVRELKQKKATHRWSQEDLSWRGGCTGINFQWFGFNEVDRAISLSGPGRDTCKMILVQLDRE